MRKITSVLLVAVMPLLFTSTAFAAAYVKEMVFTITSACDHESYLQSSNYEIKLYGCSQNAKTKM